MRRSLSLSKARINQSYRIRGDKPSTGQRFQISECLLSFVPPFGQRVSVSAGHQLTTPAAIAAPMWLERPRSGRAVLDTDLVIISGCGPILFRRLHRDV